MSQTDHTTKKELIDEAQSLVLGLIEVKHKLEENECNFVLGLEEKLKRWGYGAFVSPKQMNWLRILDKKYVPDERQAELF